MVRPPSSNFFYRKNILSKKALYQALSLSEDIDKFNHSTHNLKIQKANSNTKKHKSGGTRTSLYEKNLDEMTPLDKKKIDTMTSLENFKGSEIVNTNRNIPETSRSYEYDT